MEENIKRRPTINSECIIFHSCALYNFYRLVDEMKTLSSNYDVARYVHTDNGRNHMAVLLNMDFQMIFVKKIRCFLKLVMEDGSLNCLFYKLYSDPTVMGRVRSNNSRGHFDISLIVLVLFDSFWGKPFGLPSPGDHALIFIIVNRTNCLV